MGRSAWQLRCRYRWLVYLSGNAGPGQAVGLRFKLDRARLVLFGADDNKAPTVKGWPCQGSKRRQTSRVFVVGSDDFAGAFERKLNLPSEQERDWCDNGYS